MHFALNVSVTEETLLPALAGGKSTSDSGLLLDGPSRSFLQQYLDGTRQHQLSMGDTDLGIGRHSPAKSVYP